jgi:hypothetical protein
VDAATGKESGERVSNCGLAATLADDGEREGDTGEAVPPAAAREEVGFREESRSEPAVESDRGPTGLDRMALLLPLCTAGG